MPVQLVDMPGDAATGSSRFDTMQQLDRRIAQAQPIRGRDARQGWTISD
jgi:hypothetical protein